MAKFEMDTDFIRKLAAILEETGLGEIELADGERKIRVARPTTIAASAPRRSPWPRWPAAGAGRDGARRRRRRRPTTAIIRAP